MTSLQKIIIGAALVVAIGIAVHQGRQASTLRDENRMLQQQQVSAAEQVRSLQRERDEAANRLAALAGDTETVKAHSSELLKLRGEVGRLRREAEDAAVELEELKKEQARMERFISNTPPVGATSL